MPWRIMEASAKEIQILGEAEGWTDLDTCTIYLRRGLHKSRIKDTLLHEICHAIFDGSGAYYAIQSLFSDSDVSYDLVERLIRALVPNLLTVFRQMKGILP